MWDLVSFAQSHARKVCLLALATGPKIPTAIASAAGMNLSHISRALRELSEKGLVKCLTPNLTKNKIYQITPSGLEISEKLKILDTKP
jgi:DNA-binding MarR family transcriptional regulator